MPVSASQSAGIESMSHCAWLTNVFCKVPKRCVCVVGKELRAAAEVAASSPSILPVKLTQVLRDSLGSETLSQKQ